MAQRKRKTRTALNGIDTPPTFDTHAALKALDAIGATYEEVRMPGGPSLLVGWKGDNLLVAFKPLRKWAAKWKGDNTIHANSWPTLFDGMGVGTPMQTVVLKKLAAAKPRRGRPPNKARRGPGRPRLHPAPDAAAT